MRSAQPMPQKVSGTVARRQRKVRRPSRSGCDSRSMRRRSRRWRRRANRRIGGHASNRQATEGVTLAINRNKHKRYTAGGPPRIGATGIRQTAKLHVRQGTAGRKHARTQGPNGNGDNEADKRGSAAQRLPPGLHQHGGQ